MGADIVTIEEVTSILRIRVSEPENLITLADLLMIEGPPGCGKTTLLKMLAIRLLDKDKKVIFLPCSAINPNCSERSLNELAREFGHGVTPNPKREAECILIIDGLDEAPFDLTDHILKARDRGNKMVVSVRTAFKTRLRGAGCLSIGLAPFTEDERKEFFQKWFRNRDENYQRVMDLIDAHEDIDIHTRLPLIATIAGALIDSGFSPHTREEIYSFRLNLLLSKWDRARGVRRLRIDDSDAKRRAIAQLAFNTHNAKTRKRTFSMWKIKDAFSEALGRWSSEARIEDLVHDLVIGSGILVRERSDTYSFGHLTFQEHLAGTFLAQKLTVKEIARFMGDDWWREPLSFYASIVGSLDQLIDKLMEEPHFPVHMTQLQAMSALAPYTSDGALQMIGAVPSPIH